MIRAVLAGVAVAAAFTSTALAADMALKAPPAPVAPPSWTGFYLGLNAGGMWSNQSVNVGGGAATLAAIAAGQLPSSLAGNPAGFIGGGQLGYNFQNGWAVYGIEADIQGSSFRSTQTAALAPAGFAPFTTSATQQLDMFGTVRGRVGFTPTPALLLYGTGGLAYGDERLSATDFGTAAGCSPAGRICTNGSSNGVRAGWTAGAGLEYALNSYWHNWSLKVEYLYYDLGTRTFTLTDVFGRFPGTFQTYSDAFKGNIVRAGVNYKF